MSNNQPSFRLPFTFPDEVHESVKNALRLTYQGVLDLNQAVVALKPKLGVNTTIVQTLASAATASSGGGGGGTFPSFGSVNLQPNLTPGAYTLAQADLAGLILVQSAIAFALTLNSGLMTPFFTTVYNFGSATITATPSLGNVNNGASVPVKPGQFSIFYFDSNGDWWDVFPILAQSFTAIPGQFLTSYDSTTGLFTAAAVGVPLVTSVTLTSPQLLALKATPVQVLAAPGSGSALLLFGSSLDYKFGTVPYVDGGGGGNFRLQYASLAFGGQNSSPTAGFIDQASSQIYAVTGAGSMLGARTSYDNQAIFITHADTGELTAGDGTLTVTTYYNIVTLS